MCQRFFADRCDMDARSLQIECYPLEYFPYRFSGYVVMPEVIAVHRSTAPTFARRRYHYENAFSIHGRTLCIQAACDVMHLFVVVRMALFSHGGVLFERVETIAKVGFRVQHLCWVHSTWQVYVRFIN